MNKSAIPSKWLLCLVLGLVLCAMTVAFTGCASSEVTPSDGTSDTTVVTDGVTTETVTTEAETTEAPVTAHDYTVSEVAPTCTEAGKTVYTCVHCGDSYEETLEATGHAYTETVTEATCTADGAKVSVCSTCGDTVTETLPAHGHSYTESITEATCTTDGAKVNVCATCGDTVTETLPAHGHSYTESVIAATCTEKGSSTKTCSACGDTVTESIKALGHKHKTTTTAATCTKDGSKVTTCSRCDYKKTEAIKALGHDYKESCTATCTEAGEKVTTCSRCDYKKAEALEALGHDHVVKTTNPTCTARGKTVTTCTRCDYKKTKYLNATGHIYDDYVCTAKGCGYSNIFYASDYGVVGNGVTDDGPAISAAVNAAKSARGKLVFDKNKTYYIGTSTNKDAHFETPFLLVNAVGFTIDGQGSTFKMSPHLSYFTMWACDGVTIKNCNFDYSVSVYLVGTVKSISGNTVVFTTDIEPYKDYYDYSGLTAFSVYKYNSGVQGYPHGFIKTMTKSGSKQVTVTYSSGMTYSVGQLVYLPNPGVGHVGSEAIYMGASKGPVTLENIEIRAARNFVFHITGNEGETFLNNVDLVPGSTNNRAIKMVAWRDGFHCKDNRGAIHWTNCENGALFDDVMNIRNGIGYITSVSNAKTFAVVHYANWQGGTSTPLDCKAGDVLDFYDQDNDIYYGYATVKSVTVSNNTSVVTLDTAGCTVDLTKVNRATCRVGNRATCAPGSTITNCEFSGSLRLNRDVTVTDTVFNIYYAIWILAEGGVEGPIPGNITFRNCTFRYAYIHIDGYNRWDTGRYMPNIASHITGIRAYNCTFENGCYVKSETGCRLERY